MKKISISDSEKKLLFIVLSLGILAAAYFFGFTKLNEEVDALEASNMKDSAEVRELEDMEAQRGAKEEETKAFKKGIADIVEKYPSEIPQAKAIYLAQEFQNLIGTDIISIGFIMDRQVQSFSGDNPPTGKYSNMAIQYAADYDQFKELLRYVGAFPDRTTIPSITANYDEATGLLKGTLNYKMYYLTDTGKEYVEFPETGIPAGKAGIFYPADWSPAMLEELLNSLQ